MTSQITSRPSFRGEGVAVTWFSGFELSTTMAFSQSNNNYIQTFKPKLPLELIDLIIELAPVETYANLALCNRWLYKTCNPLLYRDVYLYTPTQLIKLYESENARSMLDTTDALFIDESIFFDKTWKRVQKRLDLVDYLIRTLQTTISLRRLQVLHTKTSNIDCSHQDIVFCNKFNICFFPLLHDPGTTLLPKLDALSLIKSVARIGLGKVASNRPVAFYSTSTDTCFFVEIFSALSVFDQPNDFIWGSDDIKARLKVLGSPDRSLSADDVGLLIREAVFADGALSTTIKSLRLKMRFINALIEDKPPLTDDIFPWIRTMISAVGWSQLETLHLSFTPENSDLSLGEQHSVLQELQKCLPALTKAEFASSRVEWRRQSTASENASCAYPSLPDWTPRPAHHYPDTSPNMLVWWINALNFEVSKAQSHETLRRIAREMRKAMATRWPSDTNSFFYCPDEESLYRDLLSHVQ